MGLRAVEVLATDGTVGLAGIGELGWIGSAGGQPQRFAFVTHGVQVLAGRFVAAGPHTAQTIDADRAFANVNPR